MVSAPTEQAEQLAGSVEEVTGMFNGLPETPVSKGV